MVTKYTTGMKDGTLTHLRDSRLCSLTPDRTLTDDDTLTTLQWTEPGKRVNQRRKEEETGLIVE